MWSTCKTWDPNDRVRCVLFLQSVTLLGLSRGEGDVLPRLLVQRQVLSGCGRGGGRRGGVIRAQESPVTPLNAAVGCFDVVVRVFANVDNVATCGPLARRGILDEDRLSHLEGGEGT